MFRMYAIDMNTSMQACWSLVNCITNQWLLHVVTHATNDVTAYWCQSSTLVSYAWGWTRNQIILYRYLQRVFVHVSRYVKVIKSQVFFRVMITNVVPPFYETRLSNCPSYVSKCKWNNFLYKKQGIVMSAVTVQIVNSCFAV